MSTATARKPKIDLGRIRQRDPATLKPAAINDRIYKPVDLDDPDIVVLADSIQKHGLKVPIVVTRDDVILSGHRRQAACIVAGLYEAPVLVEDINSWDDEFPQLLIEYNRQRVKSFDEVLREEVISADPEEAHRVLMEHRQKASRIYVETIEIREAKRRPTISAAKQPMLDAILAIIDSLQDFWPLSDRQIHYQLLNDPPLIHASKPNSRYRNDQTSYRATTELVTRARFEGHIDWEAIHDPTRPVTIGNFSRDRGLFVRDQLDSFLKGYYRDLMQSQPNHIEIVGEKNTIAGVIRSVALNHCIPMTIGRGYSSTPPRRKMWERFNASGKERLVLLVLSDFDPEGEDIAHSFARSMRDDFRIDNVEAVKVALTVAQIEEMNLPRGLKAKEKSSRRSRFVEEHGEYVHELESVEPSRLQSILTEAINSIIDIDAFNREIDAEKHDAVRLDDVRRRVQKMLAEQVNSI